jgi:hypothetical protein
MKLTSILSDILVEQNIVDKGKKSNMDGHILVHKGNIEYYTTVAYFLIIIKDALAKPVIMGGKEFKSGQPILVPAGDIIQYADDLATTFSNGPAGKVKQTYPDAQSLINSFRGATGEYKNTAAAAVLAYIRSTQIREVQPQFNKTDKYLVRGASDKNAYLINYPTEGKKQAVKDIPEFSAKAKNITKAYQDAILITDKQLAKYKNSNIAKRAEKASSMTRIDQLAVMCIAAAVGPYYIGGTDENMLISVASELTSTAKYNTLNATLANIGIAQSLTTADNDEIIVIRAGKADTFKWEAAKDELGESNAWDIWGRMAWGGANSKEKCIQKAAVPDYWVNTIFGSSEVVLADGFYGVIKGEMDAGYDRDIVLLKLVSNNICQFEQSSNSCIFPDGKTLGFDQKMKPGQFFTSQDKAKL